MNSDEPPMRVLTAIHPSARQHTGSDCIAIRPMPGRQGRNERQAS